MYIHHLDFLFCVVPVQVLFYFKNSVVFSLSIFRFFLCEKWLPLPHSMACLFTLVIVPLMRTFSFMVGTLSNLLFYVEQCRTIFSFMVGTFVCLMKLFYYAKVMKIFSSIIF